MIFLTATLSIDERDREPVVTFTPDSLKRGCADTRFQREILVESPDSLYALILAVRVYNRAFSNDIVDNDDAPRPREPQRPVEVLGNVRLVRIDKGEVE